MRIEKKKKTKYVAISRYPSFSLARVCSIQFVAADVIVTVVAFFFFALLISDSRSMDRIQLNTSKVHSRV